MTIRVNYMNDESLDYESEELALAGIREQFGEGNLPVDAELLDDETKETVQRLQCVWGPSLESYVEQDAQEVSNAILECIQPEEDEE